MKSTKILFVATALALSLGAYSQTDTTRKDTTAHKMDTTAHKMDTKQKRPSLNESTTTNLQEQQSATTQQATSSTITGAATTNSAANTTSGNNAAAVTNSSMSAGMATAGSNLPGTPKPNFGRYYIPVIGSFNAVATTAENKSIKITGDENNPGKIWVEGLSANKFYALLKTVPGTYKIPAQKQEVNTVAEGTLIYDENSKQVNVCTGCGFNEQAPTVADALASVKETPATAKSNHHQQADKIKKMPVISFTGIKADQGTVSLLQ